jgi:hypothetical protein
MKLFRNLAVGAASLFAAMTMASTASADGSVVLLQPTCNLYAEGCLFSWTPPPGNIFEDPVAIMAAYNATHAAAPPPEDLTGLNFLGKAEAGGSIPFTVNANGSWSFTDLPWDVAYYTVKQAGDTFLLFGLNPATDTFTAVNTQIGTNGGISHVSFFGGPGGAVPEPATWAMMILGFGMVGAGMRMRRRLPNGLAV